MRKLFRLVWLFGLFGSFVLPAQGSTFTYFQAAELERFEDAPELPNLSLPDLDGKPVSLRALRGKVILLNFWTTW